MLGLRDVDKIECPVFAFLRLLLTLCAKINNGIEPER